MTDAVRMPLPGPVVSRPTDDVRMRALSQQLEAGFLAEMLGHAGLVRRAKALVAVRGKTSSHPSCARNRPMPWSRQAESDLPRACSTQ